MLVLCSQYLILERKKTSHSPPGRGEGQMQEGEGRKEVQADAKGTLSLCLVSLLYGGGF